MAKKNLEQFEHQVILSYLIVFLFGALTEKWFSTLGVFTFAITISILYILEYKGIINWGGKKKNGKKKKSN